MIDLDAPTPSRRKPLDRAIRDGRAHWRRQLKQRLADAQRALDHDDLTAAANFLRRARVCETALQRWDAVAASAARGAIA